MLQTTSKDAAIKCTYCGQQKYANGLFIWQRSKHTQLACRRSPVWTQQSSVLWSAVEVADSLLIDRGVRPRDWHAADYLLRRSIQAYSGLQYVEVRSTLMVCCTFDREGGDAALWHALQITIHWTSESLDWWSVVR